MSETPDTQDTVDELQIAKNQADTLGIRYSPRIGLEALGVKITKHLQELHGEEPTVSIPTSNPETAKDSKPTSITFTKEQVEKAAALNPADSRSAAIRAAAKLVRLRITCMNPAKKAWTGEVLTVSNSVAGTFKKFVQFETEEGWCVPSFIHKFMEERKFISSRTVKRNGREVRLTSLVKEYAIEVLPPLTKQELHKLAQRQAMAKGSEAEV